MSSILASLPRLSIGAALLASSLMLALPAAAEAPTAVATVSDPTLPRLDIGGTTGINNPGGFYGAEAQYRLVDQLALGVAGGSGAWGPRVTPEVRYYPFGASRVGFFLESGLSFNFGGRSDLKVNGVVTESANLLMTPVVNAALGYRFSFGQRGWLALRVGYGFSLRSDNVTTDTGAPPSSLLKVGIDLSQPGGLMAGLSAGFSIL